MVVRFGPVALEAAVPVALVVVVAVVVVVVVVVVAAAAGPSIVLPLVVPLPPPLGVSFPRVPLCVAAVCASSAYLGAYRGCCVSMFRSDAYSSAIKILMDEFVDELFLSAECNSIKMNHVYQ